MFVLSPKFHNWPHKFNDMEKIIQATQIVFNDRRNIILGIVSAVLFGTIFVFGSGMITFFQTGPYIEFNPVRFAILFMLVLFSGLVIPMHFFAIKKAKAGLKEGASGAGGILAGMATMSCCAPLLLPSLLSFVGFSGTQLLFFNVTLKRYSLYFALAAIGFLIVSLTMVSVSIISACRIERKRI